MQHSIAITSSNKGLPQKVHAVHNLPHPCGADASASLCAMVSAELSIHNLATTFASYDAKRLQIVWPDAAQLTQATSVDLRAHLGDDSAEFASWQQGAIAQQLLDASPTVTAAEEPRGLDSMLNAACCSLGVSGGLIDALAELDAILPDHSAEPPADAPNCLPQLVAVYEEIDTAILVVRDTHGLELIDWAAVRAHFSQFANLLLTTTKQFHLLAHTQLAVAFGIGRYRYQWGEELTSTLVVPIHSYILNASQTIIEIYTKSLPRGVMLSADLAKLIHDIQNQLLKAQFQYELLNMMFDISEQAAPRLHSDRTLPFRKRIDALVVHLREWVAVYTALLDADE